jgi:N-acetylglucosamine kinase-like BadF-type ATPase
VGIVVLAGTGSISYGQDRAGKSARSGGFGFLLADEGSGYWLGHQALRATVRAADGRGPDTRIRPIVFEALEVSSVSDLVPRVYEKGLPKHRIAALAGVVQRARDEGDAVAAALIDAGARELALAARAVRASSTSATDPSRWCWPGARSRPVPRWCPPGEAPRPSPAPVPPCSTSSRARGAVRLALDLLQP